ncbi:hypothetical protein EPYR_01696 [Erwinia pyrifoliae DSM 12163]|nr:hypothetical protein EPYR_01696 [Erwinia pyrifoliae DSM 12163]
MRWKQGMTITLPNWHGRQYLGRRFDSPPVAPVAISH